MSRTERVEAVLSSRRKQATGLDLEIGRALSTRDALDVLDAEASHLAQRAGADVAHAIAQVRSRIADACSVLNRELAVSASLRTRLARTTLSIGAVGRSGQGKSRFLQSLTGLTADQIPDSSGTFCTGVTSVIRHAAGTTATVTFKSEAEYLALLTPYYSRLNVGPVPTTLAAALAGNPSRPSFADDESDGKELYEALIGYLNSLRANRQRVGAAPLAVEPSTLRTWITQTTEDGEPRTEFRVVDRVDITAPFASDLAGVSVVDLPGLGDTNLSDMQRIIDAVSDEIDVLVVLRRPDPLRDDWMDKDFELYNAVAAAYPDVPMADRSFLLLNRTKSPSDNEAACRRLAQSERLQSLPLAETLIADATEPSQVATAFDEIVEHLLASTGDIERSLVTARAQALRSATSTLQDVLATANEVFGAVAEAAPNAATKTVELTRRTHKALAVALEDLVASTKEARQRPDNHLANKITEVVEGARADKGIPDTDEVAQQVKLRGGVVLAYGYLLNEARAHLAEHFTNLEPALGLSVDEVRGQVVSILKTDGRLASVTDAGSDWLIGLAEDLELDVLPDGSPIPRALRTLANAKLTYRGFLQHRIRPLLDGLNPDHPLVPTEQNLEYNADDVRSMVEAAYDSALRAVDAMLRTDLVSEPSSAVFALIEEFVDGALRSENAEAHWHAIYLQHKNRIWPEEWESLAEDQADLKRWKRVIREFEEAIDHGAGMEEHDDANA